MAASDGWVIDGGYRGKLGDLVWERADTVVWLDQPLPLIMGRLLRRTHGRIRRDEELWSGNRESWRNMFGAGTRSSAGRFVRTSATAASTRR